MAAITMTPHELCDLRMLAWGAYAPLDGFLRREDYLAVTATMRLSSGALWPIPITLSPPEDLLLSLRHAREVELLGPEGRFVGFLQEPELYQVDPFAEARSVYGTDDEAHPGAAQLLKGGEWRLGG